MKPAITFAQQQFLELLNLGDSFACAVNHHSHSYEQETGKSFFFHFHE
jgi:hypothetical protein